MPKIESFRHLLVWQKSIDPALRCHHVARRFPREEQTDAAALIADAEEVGRMLYGLVRSLERAVE